MTIKERAAALKRDIPAVFLALRRPETPFAAKIAAGLAVAYALSPVDIIPDFIPVLGYLDDLVILPVLVEFAIRLIPPAVLEDCRAKADGLWKDGRPKHWYYAIPILLLWGLVLYLILRAVLQ